MSTTDDRPLRADRRFYVAGGTLGPEAPSYVVRRADAELFDGLTRREFCYVLTARQMGKSSLIARTATRLRREGVAVVVLDLTSLGQNLSAEQWYDGLCDGVAEYLDLDEELAAFWRDHARLSPLKRWMQALRDVVLARVPGPIVIFVDEIDVVRSLPFSTDEFFAAIRECYNRRTEDPELTRLTFCLVGVATPADLIRDTRTTPFNIGRRIELSDFTEAEAAPLVMGLTPPRPSPRSGERDGERGSAQALLHRILYWTGGHPYLTQRLCQAVAEQPRAVGDNTPSAVDALCEELFLSPRAREGDDNLLFVRERLLRSEVDLAGLLDLYARVRAGKRVRNEETNPLLDVLRLSGIVRRLTSGPRPSTSLLPRWSAIGRRRSRSAADGLQVRNRVYAQVFNREWVLRHMPDAELRRQRAAFRRGLIRAGVVAGVLIAVLTGLTGYAWSQRNQARAASRRSELLAASLRGALHRESRARQDLENALAAAKSERNRANGEAGRANREATAAEKARSKADAARRTADENAAQARRQEGLARQAEATERAERLRNARLLYDADMQLASQAWEQGATRRVKDLLAAHEPKPGEEDLRGFDWRYQWRLLNRNARVLRGHTDGAHLGAFAPDGHLITVDADRQLRHWNLVSGRPTRTLSFASECPLYYVALSHDGQTLAARTAGGGIRLLDTTTGHVRQVLMGHGPGAILRTWMPSLPRMGLSLAFSPDDKRLVSLGAFDSTARIWDLSNGREAHRIDGLEMQTWVGEIARDLALSPDGTTLALSEYPFGDYQVTLFDVRKSTARGSQIRSLSGPGGTVCSVLYSPDGKTLACGAHGGQITLADPATGKSLHEITAHSQGVYRLAFSPDGKTLATGSIGDALVKLWDVATGRQLRVLKGHTAPITFIAYSPDGKKLATGARDGTARVWDLTANPETRVLTAHANIVRQVAYSPNGRLLATASWDRTARLWDARTGRLLQTLPPQKWAVTGLAISPDSRTLATGGFESEVKLWDLGTALQNSSSPVVRERHLLGELPASYRPWYGRAVGSLAFSPDARWLAAGHGHAGGFMRDYDPIVQVWDLTTFTVNRLRTGHRNSISAVLFSPDGRQLVGHLSWG